jgi:hypothetical protein
MNNVPYNHSLVRITSADDVRNILIYQHNMMKVSSSLIPIKSSEFAKQTDCSVIAWYFPSGSLKPAAITLLKTGNDIHLTPWIITGTTEDRIVITLHHARFDSFPGLHTPKMLCSFSIFYTSQLAANRQPTNNAINATISDNQFIIPWKGDIVIVKHACHCASCFTDITKEDRVLYSAMVTAAIYNGQL